MVKSVENYKNGISADLFVCIGCILIDVVRCSTTSIFSKSRKKIV